MDIVLSLPAERVIRVLDQVIEWCGKPLAIRSDNRPECISSKLVLWTQKNGICLEHIQPGNPQQNAYVERYNRTVLSIICLSPSPRCRSMALVGSGHTITKGQTRLWEALHLNRSWPAWPDLYFWRALKMGELP